MCALTGAVRVCYRTVADIISIGRLMPRCLLAFWFLLLFSAVLVFGQAETAATLSGTVTDSSEALLPGVRVRVIGSDNGLIRESVSDDRGDYRVPLLPPGNYTLEASKQGFAPHHYRGLVATVGGSLVLDIKLDLGASNQTVEVTGEALTVETERSHQADLITEEAVRALPINRRDYLSFTLLAPGVSDTKAQADSTGFRVRQTSDSGLSFYGSNGRGNNITVDGGEVNDSGGGVRPTVSQEAVQEFQINRSNYSAEHSSSRGGVINIVTRSGTNLVHGSLFGFFRSDALDAGDPFAVNLQADGTLRRVKPPSNRQQFGGSVGGPVAKDKTFYFLAYEQLRRRESVTVPVLTDLAIFQPTAAQEAILQKLPATSAAKLRAALTSPPSTIDLFRVNSGVFPFQTDQYQGLLRIDHQFNPDNQASFRYNATQSFDTNQNVAALVGFSRGYVQENLDSDAIASWTHTFSPQLINQARAQFNYNNPLTGSNDPYGPALEIAGYGFFNRDRFLPSSIITRNEELQDNLNWTRGTHLITAGAYTLIRYARINSQTFFSGRFTFGALPGAIVSPALASTSINALQAFNLGLAQSYQQGFGNGIVKATYPLYAGFAQDSWKVLPNLTVNYGVRYEVDHRKDPLPTPLKNFAPRVGFAWDPFGTKKTVVRGGYGLYYATVDFQIDYVVNALAEIHGFRQIAQVLTTLNAANPAAKNGPISIFKTLRAEGIIGVPTPLRPILASDLAQFGIIPSQTGPRPPLSVLFSNVADYQDPLAQQASLGIEHEFSPGFSAAASYIFVRGEHLTNALDGNLLEAPINPAKGIRDWGVTPENPTGTKYFRDPLLFQNNVYQSNANSFYHGLILEAKKRFGNNASLNGNYTFSKAIDETVDYNSDFEPNDQTCRRCERALSAFDQRHKVVLYAMLQVPSSSSGSRWKSMLGGFQWSPIYRYNSARPFNLLAGTEINNDRHNTTDRPIFAGRNTGIGPSFWTFDTRLSRRFHMTERTSLDLIAEGFNLLNHLNYATVNNTVGNISGPFNLRGRDDRSPSQPLGFTSAYDPRRIQLGLRFIF